MQKNDIKPAITMVLTFYLRADKRRQSCSVSAGDVKLKQLQFFIALCMPENRHQSAGNIDLRFTDKTLEGR